VSDQIEQAGRPAGIASSRARTGAPGTSLPSLPRSPSVRSTATSTATTWLASSCHRRPWNSSSSCTATCKAAGPIHPRQRWRTSSAARPSRAAKPFDDVSPDYSSRGPSPAAAHNPGRRDRGPVSPRQSKVETGPRRDGGQAAWFAVTCTTCTIQAWPTTTRAKSGMSWPPCRKRAGRGKTIVPSAAPVARAR